MERPADPPTAGTLVIPPRIIILCHGQQKRLPALDIPKQLLPLTRGGPTIIGRTLRMLRETFPNNVPILIAPNTPAWQPVVDDGAVLHSLVKPGLCVLEGLIQTAHLWGHSEGPDDPGRTVILLGDVIYSMGALRSILTDGRPLLFHGSADLTTGGGEIFSLSFSAVCKTAMAAVLADIDCLKHQAEGVYSVYQPGHLRNLLWEVLGRKRGNELQPMPSPDVYQVVDDYTTDVDTPVDLEEILRLGPELERLGELYGPGPS